MLRLLRKRFVKVIAVYLALVMVVELAYPTVSWALTSGPSQPEVQSFEPISTTQMVDPFSGKFTYNIPLLELPGPDGGYPFNLAYHSGITMDQESSWTGLGWNLNPGAITRNMRGLPDEFSGESIKRRLDMKPNNTLGFSGSTAFKIFGGNTKLGLNVSLGMSVYNNSYNGVGYSISPGLDFAVGNESSLTAGVGITGSLDSQSGFSVRPSASISSSKSKYRKKYSLGANLSSRSGLEDV